MNNLHFKIIYTAFLTLMSLTLTPTKASAAGSLDMQIERAIVKAIKDYNSAMSEGDPSSWLKYFDTEATRTDPISSSLQGLQKITDYYTHEFSLFSANFEIKRVMLKERTGAVEMIWQATDKSSGTEISLPMIGIFELASSGKFKSVNYYYDTASGEDSKTDALLEKLKMP